MLGIAGPLTERGCSASFVPSHRRDLVPALCPRGSPQPPRSLLAEHGLQKFAASGGSCSPWEKAPRLHPSAEMQRQAEPGRDAGLSRGKPWTPGASIPRKAITAQQITGLIKSHYAISESKSDPGAADGYQPSHKKSRKSPPRARMIRGCNRSR